jgi:hypothetical protein
MIPEIEKMEDDELIELVTEILNEIESRLIQRQKED